MTTTPITEQTELRFEAERSGDVRSSIIVPLVQNVIGGGALTILLCLALAAFNALDFDTALGAGAIGLGAACFVTLVRFFYDDFGWLNIAYKAGAASRQPEIDDLKKQNHDLGVKLSNATRPIVVHKRPVDTFVKPEAPDPAWEDAVFILSLVVDGRIPGRGRTELSQARQVAALAMLARAGVLYRKHNTYELNCTPEEAQKRLLEIVDRQQPDLD